ncbi:MAG: hypothetical protein JWM39_345 [Parcubacteria group bacterium]|nr:hypothetical protein [Parcubacteria group bacterium]
MYIREAKKLAQALAPILKDRVLVRYAVQGWGKVSYTAELVVVATIGGEDFLYQAQITLLVVRGITQIESDFRLLSLKTQPDILESVTERWLRRSADDWCHGEQFMGAYEILRDGQLYTSVKLPPFDPRWHLLVGVILSELGAQQGKVNPRNAVDTGSINLMNKRYSAFAAESISGWAHQTFSAH